MQTTIAHYLEYYSLRLLQELLSIMPRNAALRIGAAIGTLLYWSGAYRSIVRKNMDLVGWWTPVQTAAIKKRLYRNMGRYAVDFLRSTRPRPNYRTHNFETIEAMQQKGKGTIVLLAHFGNWEILADLFGSRVRNLNVVAKPMKNRLVDSWLARKRDNARVTTIYMKNALRRIYSALRNNDLVAVLIDQHAGGGQGTPIPFLGKETATVRTVAGLVHKTGCAVMPVYAIMQEDGAYDIVIAAAEPPDLSGMTEDECITAYQIQHNEIIGSWIRMYPEHWFGWFHKRFREHVRYGNAS
ncbi:MAG: lysophospholipid acyltransferase family protein [Chitinispirillaceae bacterium]|nr:lysophospholipid acyltransferase family protein [Chitinispirillaceae bacterium]